MITKEAVLKALGTVQEPDLGKDLVTLNMIQDVVIDDKNISFTVVLTTPACPLKEMIERACVNAIHTLVDENAIVDVHLTANVGSNRKDNKAVFFGRTVYFCCARSVCFWSLCHAGLVSSPLRWA